MGYPNWQKRRKNKNTEGALQLQILKYLRAIGAVAGKTKTTGISRNGVFCADRYLFIGFPDITIFYKNKIYFCEVKSAKGYQSRYQQLFQELCKDSNIPYILARKLEDVMEIIK